jgi:hypothetical protein
VRLVQASSSASNIPKPQRSRIRAAAPKVALGVAGVLFAIQLVPYGHDHTNPPVQAEATFDSQQTHNLVARACYDCHSDQTVWPWYSNIAPVSWLVQRDVESGRREINFSEAGRPRQSVQKAADAVEQGDMPPSFYPPLHPTAQLSAAEKQQLIAGLVASFGRQPQRGGGRPGQQRPQS